MVYILSLSTHPNPYALNPDLSSSDPQPYPGQNTKDPAPGIFMSRGMMPLKWRIGAHTLP